VSLQHNTVKYSLYIVYISVCIREHHTVQLNKWPESKNVDDKEANTPAFSTLT